METGGNTMESSELLKRIRQELQRHADVPDSEWKTSRQWAKVWGLQQSQTNRLLCSAIEAGVMERKTFRISCPSRESYPIPHYRERPK